MAFLAGAVLAPAVPALLISIVLRVVGGAPRPEFPALVDSWLRGGAGILALVPAMLVCGSGRLQDWVALPREREWRVPINVRSSLELGVEVMLWTASLWLTVDFKARYGLNITYLTFLPPLVFTLFRGMHLATLALAGNAIMGTTLWTQLHWANALPAGDFRLLIANYSVTVLVLGAVVDERQRSREQVERLLTEETVLRESERYFRTLANSAPVMICIFGPDKLCRFVNKPWLDFVGRSIEQELDYGWLDGLHPEDYARCVDTYQSSFEVRSNFRMEVRFRRANGEYRWILVNGVPLYRDGQFAGYIGSCVDVTEQKLSAELLQENEQRLQAAQQLAHVGSWHWDLITNEVSCSEECVQIFGQPKDYRPSLEALLEIIAPRDRERVAHEIKASIGEKSGYSTEFQIARPNGELRTVTFTSRILLNKRGLPRHIFGACQDVTDLRRTQEETFARQKLETVGTLASGIAHDFNNLLGGVLMQAEVALAECASGSYPEQELKGIRTVAIRGSEIVRQLLIYAGKESETPELVDVSRVVTEMIELVTVSVSKHARLEIDLGQDLPAVRGNVAQLRQIVMNLVTNASEAIGDRDGVIRVTTNRVEVGRDGPGAIPGRLPEGDYLQLQVSDTGCGMSRETQARVFDPFFTTKSAGHGLGLAVVHGIVRSLGGAIQVVSETGQGSTFQVLLPCAATKAEAISDPLPGAGESTGPSEAVTVLVVEDEDLLRQAVVKMLRRAGFEVREASDGSAAIDLLRADGGTIDLMLLDMTMPGSSSSEVVSEAVRARPEIRVILTSAYSQEMLTPRLMTSQIRGFVRKPVQFADLVKTLRNALSS